MTTSDMDEKNALEELRMMSDRLHNEKCVQDIVASDLTFVADRIEREWVELPRDKDGEIIHFGDHVYDRNDRSGKVVEMTTYMSGLGQGWTVSFHDEQNPIRCQEASAKAIRHIPDSLEQIAAELKKLSNHTRGISEPKLSAKLAKWADRIRKLAEKEGE